MNQTEMIELVNTLVTDLLENSFKARKAYDKTHNLSNEIYKGLGVLYER